MWIFSSSDIDTSICLSRTSRQTSLGPFHFYPPKSATDTVFRTRILSEREERTWDFPNTGISEKPFAF